METTYTGFHKLTKCPVLGALTTYPIPPLTTPVRVA